MSATYSEENASSDDHREDLIPLELRTNELVCAASDGLVDKVDFLIGSGHDVTGDIGCAALLNAAASGHAAVVASLLAAGAPVDGFERPYVETPLMKAAAGGHIKAVELLLAAGADIEATDENCMAALAFASFNGHGAVATALLEAGAQVYNLHRSPISHLMHAAHGGHVNVIEILLMAGADIELAPVNGRTALGYAAGNGKVEAVAYLLARGAHVDGVERRFSPLMEAAQGGHFKVVELLLEAGANFAAVDVIGETALCYAAGGGHVEIVASLLSARAQVEDVNDDVGQLQAPLMEAARGGHVKVVELLLAAAADEDCEAALGPAAEEGHVEVIRVLIKAGANVNLENTRSSALNSTIRTPLFLAVDGGYPDVVQELLAAGADPDSGVYKSERQPDGIKTGHTATPLMRAASKSSLDILRILLERGANVNFICIGGWTALIKGAKTGDSEVVRLLLEAGADPFAHVNVDPNQSADLVPKVALDLACGDAVLLLEREMKRRKAAALSVMPAEVPLQVRQEIMRLAYSWKPS